MNVAGSIIMTLYVLLVWSFLIALTYKAIKSRKAFDIGISVMSSLFVGFVFFTFAHIIWKHFV